MKKSGSLEKSEALCSRGKKRKQLSTALILLSLLSKLSNKTDDNVKSRVWLDGWPYRSVRNTLQICIRQMYKMVLEESYL
jgi:hypothetical protein